MTKDNNDTNDTNDTQEEINRTTCCPKDFRKYTTKTYKRTIRSSSKQVRNNSTKLKSESTEEITQEEMDFDTARDNLLQIVKMTQKSLESLSELANTSQNHRAYEVLGKLVDSAVSANKEFLGLQNTKQEIKYKKTTLLNPSQPQIINQTAIFHGSTADLQKLLKGNDYSDSANPIIDMTSIDSPELLLE
jgi:hypothetical protein